MNLNQITIPSLNLEKLRNDTIKKLEKEKQTKETQEKLQQQKYDYENYLNISHIKNSKQFKDMNEEYFDRDLLKKRVPRFSSTSTTLYFKTNY